jgi:transcription antitermination factor NusG
VEATETDRVKNRSDSSLRQWYVFYTKSRHEKKVRDYLLHKGFDVFLPMTKEIRQWSDRKKKVEAPLFRSYIFVSVEPYRFDKVLAIPGVSWQVRNGQHPGVLHDFEYQALKRLLDTGFSVESTILPDFDKGDSVKVIEGPLKGMMGTVFSNEPQKFNILLHGIGQMVRVDINPVLLKKIGTNE